MRACSLDELFGSDTGEGGGHEESGCNSVLGKDGLHWAQPGELMNNGAHICSSRLWEPCPDGSVLLVPLDHFPS